MNTRLISEKMLRKGSDGKEVECVGLSGVVGYVAVSAPGLGAGVGPDPRARGLCFEGSNLCCHCFLFLCRLVRSAMGLLCCCFPHACKTYPTSSNVARDI